MNKRVILALVATLLLALVLAACGDATATSKPAATADSGSMPGITMKPAETMAPSTTAAANATTAASGSMPGTAMGTTAASGAMASDPMTDSLKGLSGKEFEVMFMQEMIAHHQSALDMAKLVPTNTKRAELIKLSQNIITAQTKEIGDMTGWLASWYNSKPLADNMSAPGMMAMMGDMDKLKTAKDAAFDELFLRMMIAHHTQATNMASLIPSKTQRPELVKIGQDIIKSQSAEIEQMKGWQKTWGLKA